MKSNLLLWSAALGALPRIARYQQVLAGIESYFDRLRIVNEALGPHWVFRLADSVGLDTIRLNRPSWYSFYVEDIDRLHCPLDPGAPETESYLGRKYSNMDMAFYAGMGFDGYRLALQTSRHVDSVTKQLTLDGRYTLVPSAELRERLSVYDEQRFIPKEDYYSAYGDALTVLFEAIHKHNFDNSDDHDEVVLERVVAGCLIIMCGGHKGCLQHSIAEEGFSAQIESLIIFNHAKNVIVGNVTLDESITLRIRAIS